MNCRSAADSILTHGTTNEMTEHSASTQRPLTHANPDHLLPVMVYSLVFPECPRNHGHHQKSAAHHQVQYGNIVLLLNQTPPNKKSQQIKNLSKEVKVLFILSIEQSPQGAGKSHIKEMTVPRLKPLCSCYLLMIPRSRTTQVQNMQNHDRTVCSSGLLGCGTGLGPPWQTV